MKLKRIAILVLFLGSTLVGSSGVSAQDERTARQADEAVAAVISLPHGLFRLSAEDRAVLDAIRADPQPYVDALDRRYPLTRVSQLTVTTGAEELLEFERAIGLLAEIGNTQALGLLADWYQTLDQAVRTLDRESSNNAVFLRRFILVSLPDVKQDTIVDSILGDVRGLDDATLMAAAAYLSRSGKGDPDVMRLIDESLKQQEITDFQREQLRRARQSLER